MAEFGGALDNWLEAPYTNAARREAEFEEFCDREGIDPDAPDAWERFEDALNDEYDARREDLEQMIDDERRHGDA